MENEKIWRKVGGWDECVVERQGGWRGREAQVAISSSSRSVGLILVRPIMSCEV